MEILLSTGPSFCEPAYSSTELHYTGGLHCIALPWHVTGDMLTCEIWPPFPFVCLYFRLFVCTSVSTSQPPPKKTKFYFGIGTSISIGQEIWCLPFAQIFALTMYKDSFWHDQVRYKYNFKVQFKFFQLNFRLLKNIFLVFFVRRFDAIGFWKPKLKSKYLIWKITFQVLGT